MLLWQQRALECAAGPQFAVGHSSREFGSLKRFPVGNLRVLKDKKSIFLSSQSQVHEYL